jgi:hypothetical protein
VRAFETLRNAIAGGSEERKLVGDTARGCDSAPEVFIGLPCGRAQACERCLRRGDGAVKRAHRPDERILILAQILQPLLQPEAAHQRRDQQEGERDFNDER